MVQPKKDELKHMNKLVVCILPKNPFGIHPPYLDSFCFILNEVLKSGFHGITVAPSLISLMVSVDVKHHVYL